MTGSVSSSCHGDQRWRKNSAARFAVSWRPAGMWSGASAGNGGSDYDRRNKCPIAAPVYPHSRRLAVRACASLSRQGSTGFAMNATKILWGHVLLVCTVVLLFLWTATEWTAWQLA